MNTSQLGEKHTEGIHRHLGLIQESNVKNASPVTIRSQSRMRGKKNCLGSVFWREVSSVKRHIPNYVK